MMIHHSRLGVGRGLTTRRSALPLPQRGEGGMLHSQHELQETMTPPCEADHVRANFSATIRKRNREARPDARRNRLAVDPGRAWVCHARIRRRT
jgi:hypothetical protein